MMLLSYDARTVEDFIKTGARFDGGLIEYLAADRILHTQGLLFGCLDGYDQRRCYRLRRGPPTDTLDRDHGHDRETKARFDRGNVGTGGN